MPSQNLIGNPFIQLHKVESTNNYAMGLIHAGMAQHGTAIFAHHQSQGKGQRNKTWSGEAGKNIALSVIIHPSPLVLSQSFLLSMAIAISARQLLNNLTKDDFKIKWPNDLYWRDRKAGGILIENLLQGSEWKAAVCGIGINVNQTTFGELERSAVSMKQITGKEFDPVETARLLCNLLEQWFQQLLANPGEVINEYHRHLYKLNEKVKLRKSNRVFEAFIKGVNLNGQLIVQNQLEETFDVGEVEWVL